MKQQEIKLVFASFWSSNQAGNPPHHVGQNPERSKCGPKLEVPQGRPGAAERHRDITRGFPRGQFQFKKLIFVKFEMSHFDEFGPSPGAFGASQNPLDLPSRAARRSPSAPGNFLTWCEALFLHFASPGGHKWTERNLKQYLNTTLIFATFY